MRKRYRGLSPQQDKTLAKIATGVPLPRCHPVTLQSLERKGLIVRLPDKVIGHDAFGPIAIPQYEMPIAEHIAWCEWCAEDGHVDG